MTTYNSYEAAKIANPESTIYELQPLIGVKYTTQSISVTGQPLKTCYPANHCMTVEKFLADGHKFVEGDMVIDVGNVGTIERGFGVEAYNDPDEGDCEIYILRAAALEDKPKRTKVEYVKVEDSIFDLRDDFMSHRLFTKMDDSYSLIRFVDELSKSSMNGNLHRRIETEVDERQEFIATAFSLDGSHTYPECVMLVGKMFDSGKFKLVEGE